MIANEPLLELLALWEEGAGRGADLAPPDLCPGRPELWPELAGRISGLKRVRTAMLLDDLQAGRDTSATGQGVTQVVPRPDGVADVVARLAPPQQPDELGRLGPYRVLSVLGAGGMGVVFRAEEPALARVVALKVMRGGADHAAARERFLREAKLAAALEHDHVVPVFQVGEAGGLPYLAMPLLRGETLAERLTRDGTLSAAETVRVGREAAEGLAAAHAAGLIHRDIKPANLWLEGDRGRVKLLDFGLARGSGDATITGIGGVLGTPAFMAPEQARGEAVDGRADLFSLGGTLYRCATGRLPFAAPDAVSTLLAVAQQTPPAPHEVNPAVPAALSALITRLLAKDRTERPATARAVADELATLSTGEPPAAEVRPAPVKPRTRRRVAVAAAFVALAVLCGGVIILIKNKDGTTTKIDVPADATVEVQRDGKTVAKVEPDAKPPAVAPGSDSDRQAAEMAIALGGFVQVNDVNGEIRNVGELPKEAFRLTTCNLGHRLQVTDAGLESFKDCKHLVTLVLTAAQVTDAGLANFKTCKGLTHLSLRGCAGVTDVGLAHFAHCTELDFLELRDTSSGDDGLAHFREAKKLKSLNVSGRTTDAGLAHFKDHTAFQSLNLMSPKITDAGVAHFQGNAGLTRLELGGLLTDAGFAHFKDHKKLTWLWLASAKFTDQGVTLFRDCKDLEILDLRGTQVTGECLTAFKECRLLKGVSLDGTRATDATLAHLTPFPNLINIRLLGTQVTAKGVEQLVKAFPKSRIEWDGGLIEPTKR